MNREELYHKTVDKLLDAYNNEELMHSNCMMCAVGNICDGDNSWSVLFFTEYNHRKKESKQIVSVYNFKEEREGGLQTIANSGYTKEELMKIEFAFENSISHNYLYYKETAIKEGQYIGLCAVLDVLKEIHEKENITEDKQKLTTIYNGFKEEQSALQSV